PRRHRLGCLRRPRDLPRGQAGQGPLQARRADHARAAAEHLDADDSRTSERDMKQGGCDMKPGSRDLRSLLRDARLASIAAVLAALLCLTTIPSGPALAQTASGQPYVDPAL